ncbi:MAG: CDP-alcohol phosphatidyltransferase family protein [Holosporales bacterium]|jgi:cardiolipin synthase|nr:CDP-alcohol phosphatidyltransferase family protein [Holosporales bacterium]
MKLFLRSSHSFSRKRRASANIPNILTFLRIISAPFVLYFCSIDKYLYAVALFWFASVSDFFDGFLARYLKCESRMGRLLDPVADKTLTLFSYLAMRHEYPAIFGLVLARDIGILGAIGISAIFRLNIRISPLFIGKVNTAFVLLFPFLWLCDNAWCGCMPKCVLLYLSKIIIVTTIISAAAYAVVFAKSCTRSR